MTIHVHKSLYKLLTTRPHRGRSGKRSWAYRFTVHVSEPDGASERNPLSGSTKGAALSGLTGSRLSVTKLWCLIYVAAHSCCGRASCSPGTGKPLRRSFSGLLGGVHVCGRAPKSTPECSSFDIRRTSCLPASASGLRPTRRSSSPHHLPPHSAWFFLIALLSTDPAGVQLRFLTHTTPPRAPVELV